MMDTLKSKEHASDTQVILNHFMEYGQQPPELTYAFDVTVFAWNCLKFSRDTPMINTHSRRVGRGPIQGTYAMHIIYTSSLLILHIFNACSLSWPGSRDQI